MFCIFMIVSELPFPHVNMCGGNSPGTFYETKRFTNGKYMTARFRIKFTSEQQSGVQIYFITFAFVTFAGDFPSCWKFQWPETDKIIIFNDGSELA